MLRPPPELFNNTILLFIEDFKLYLLLTVDWVKYCPLCVWCGLELCSEKSLNVASGNFSKVECTEGIQSLSSKTWLHVVQHMACFLSTNHNPNPYKDRIFPS